MAYWTASWLAEPLHWQPGPWLWLVALMGAIAVHAADSGRREWLDLLVVIAVVAFTATVAVSRFIEDSPLMVDEQGEEVD